MKYKEIIGNRIRLFSESFGSAEDEPILLMMGATASGVWWAEEFCERLAAIGRFVIRYDHRDTGRSTSYAPGQINYSVEDLADDALAVLDGYEIAAAHLVGMSLGGLLAQLLALKNPPRVKSLTLIAAERLADIDSTLPAMDSSVLDYFAEAAEVDWSNRESIIEYQVGLWRLMSGSARQFDEKMIRRTAAADFERTPNLLTTFNHASLEGGECWFNRLSEIKTSTLIIHGTEDRVLPYPHALALQTEITDARLLTLDGAGHELHPADWQAVIQAIERQTSPKAFVNLSATD